MTTTLTITVAEIQELDQLFDELMLARRAGQGAAAKPLAARSRLPRCRPRNWLGSKPSARSPTGTPRSSLNTDR